MTFEVREYVWDHVWDGPAIVLKADPEGAEYQVAEIDEQRRLGRVSWRPSGNLSRYVRVLLPESEAMALVRSHRKRTTPAYVHAAKRARGRITKQLRKRGVDV